MQIKQNSQSLWAGYDLQDTQRVQGAKAPQISIIVPIYNVANYLKECLQSIIKQSYENLDIVLVDDGSSDESLDIALEFAKKDERIFVISKPNGGLSSARNTGLEFIKGSALREFFETRTCHTEGIARSISTNPQNRDSSLCASHFAQNDNTNAQYDKNTDTSVVSLPQYDNATCQTNSLSCHTERSEVSHKESRDSSVATQPQNDKKRDISVSPQYDKNTPYCHFERSEKSQYNNNPYNTFSLTQNQIAYSKYPAFVYIITNKIHTTLYIGVTSNLQKRIYEHKNHLAKGFSDKYNCEKLVYFESFDNIEQAIEKEKYLKGKKREFKENLIDSINPQWLDLSEYLFATHCHTEALAEVSQNQTQNRDISLHATRSAQYDKNKDIKTLTQTHNFDKTIQSLTQTHSFTKTYKDILAQDIQAHFTQIQPNFIKSDLERINEFIVQELPKNVFIHFVDSDDYIEQNCIEICVQNLLEKDLDILVHNLQEFDENTKEFKNGSYLNKLKQNEYNSGLELLVQNKIYDFYFAWQGLFKADILNRYALRFTEGIYHEDHDFGTLLFCLAHKVAYIKEALYIYRARAGSITTAQKNTNFPKKLPSFLEPLQKDFKDYKALRAYFKSYCFVRVGFGIWEFYTQKSEKDEEFKQAYKSFFHQIALSYMKIFKSHLKPDTMGVKAFLQKMSFDKCLVWREFFKDLHRQPKKIRYITNIKYLLSKDTQ